MTDFEIVLCAVFLAILAAAVIVIIGLEIARRDLQIGYDRLRKENDQYARLYAKRFNRSIDEVQT